MPDTSSTQVQTADVLAIDASVAQSTGSAQFGVTTTGFVAKPFARLLAEKLAVARALFGDDLDLSSGSAIRKILEVSALEDARTWSALSSIYDNLFIVSATGESLSRLGEELGFPRPFLEAQGSVKLKLQGKIPDGFSPLTIPRGSRMLTSGGHHVATDEPAIFSALNQEQTVAVTAFFPGPDHNLDPTIHAQDGSFPQKLDHWNSWDDDKLGTFFAAQRAAQAAGAPFDIKINHTKALTGGELQWPDERYRRLLLQAPRSIWTVDAVRLAASLVPGVRQVLVRDAWGGLDLNQSIFGDFNFIERVFSSERDIANPYYFTVLVALTPAAIWNGQDGVAASVQSAMEDLRPLGIFPSVQRAMEIGVGVSGGLVVNGLPLPSGPKDQVNQSPSAKALKTRLLERLRRYVEGLAFGQPVRAAEVTWALMNEPGIADLKQLRLLRYPPRLTGMSFGPAASTDPQILDPEQNADLQANEIAVFVDDDSRLTIT